MVEEIPQMPYALQVPQGQTSILWLYVTSQRLYYRDTNNTIPPEPEPEPTSIVYVFPILFVSSLSMYTLLSAIWWCFVVHMLMQY